MRVLALFTILIAAVAVAPQLITPREECSNPLVRKEWRSLSIQERKDYISAIQCLSKLKSKSPSDKAPGARHRYDDFNAVHIISSMGDGLKNRDSGIHMVGFFLAWHRYYIAVHESVLRNECGYKGAQPYWDWRIDAESWDPVEKWDIFNDEYGFGGNGECCFPKNESFSNPPVLGEYGGGGCVKSGPFKDWVNNVGPSQTVEYNPHCLHRNFNELMRFSMLRSNTDIALNSTTFVEFDQRVQMGGGGIIGSFHGAGHYVCGGDASDFISSSSEPVFFLHHAYLDYLYWQWQMKNPEKRLTEIGGNLKPMNPAAGTVTGETPLDLLWLAPTIPLKETFDIKAGALCYEYQ